MWDIRSSNRYYYRHRRINGRPARVYIGAGPEAEKLAREDALRQADRQAQRERRREEQAVWEDTLAVLDGLARHSDLLVHAALMAAGYYRHDMGTWRPRHDRKKCFYVR